MYLHKSEMTFDLVFKGVDIAAIPFIIQMVVTQFNTFVFNTVLKEI